MARQQRFRSEQGFSLSELMIVVGLICVLAAVTVMVSGNAIQASKADSALEQVIGQLRFARERAIADRRNVEVRFVPPNRIQVIRHDVVGTVQTGQTPLGEITLENGAVYQLTAGAPDTPDLFGNTAPIDFDTATALLFTSEGTFVDQTGDPLNGTVFIGRPNEPLTGRAVTVFGPTALIRGYRWNGSQWVE